MRTVRLTNMHEEIPITDDNDVYITVTIDGEEVTVTGLSWYIASSFNSPVKGLCLMANDLIDVVDSRPLPLVISDGLDTASLRSICIKSQLAAKREIIKSLPQYVKNFENRRKTNG